MPAKKERHAAKVQSEPLLLLMSEGSEHLKPVWEVWSRNSPDGQPPRWRELPELLQTVLEANWLEGLPRVAFEITPTNEIEDCPLAPSRYDLTFGDERQVQHSLRRASLAGWNAKVRRTVRDGEGEDAVALTMTADDQCVVCMERRRTHAFMHSDTGDGHLAVCGACAEAYKAEATAGGAARAVRTCPMCRRPFTAVQRIYQ
uniref:RING-type domain-containing protein n=1 Tax=Alexandrium catenella TaxID=2925 RepID=A0A7S1RPR0_ALECA